MSGREEFERIKKLYKESNKYMLKLDYTDIGILIQMVNALDKKARMNKVKNSSLYGIKRNKNQFENVIKILEKEQEKINESNIKEENIFVFEKNLDLVSEIIKAKDILKFFQKPLDN